MRVVWRRKAFGRNLGVKLRRELQLQFERMSLCIAW